MPLFDDAMREMKNQIVDEIEERVWERLSVQIRDELNARHMHIGDVADYLHVSETTVRRMVRDKQLPSFKVRNQILIRQMDVDAWIQSQVDASS